MSEKLFVTTELTHRYTLFLTGTCGKILIQLYIVFGFKISVLLFRGSSFNPLIKVLKPF